MLDGYLHRTTYARGSVIFRQGDPGKDLFIVTRGRASARLRQPSGSDIRLATFAAGTFFGELAILDAGARSATVIADDDVGCCVLSEERFAALMRDAPLVASDCSRTSGASSAGGCAAPTARFTSWKADPS
jgi:CRP-like cAMP-binding protein